MRHLVHIARAVRAVPVVVALAAALLVPAHPAGAGEPGSDRAIVLLRRSVAAPAAVARDHARRFGARVGFVYEGAVRGYAAAIPRSGLRALRADRRVALVEPDRRVQLPDPPGAVATSAPAVPWGLDRIDQRSLPLDGSFAPRRDGAGVTAYIVDTGIRRSHAEFGGRAESGFDAVEGGGGDDCNGHGTHVAGTVGGATSGVARAVRLVAVRVLDCRGRGLVSQVLAGVDWVTAHHRRGAPAVATMSLGGFVSDALDAAVARAVADGVTVAVAAGNGVSGFPENACDASPSRVRGAVTVAATDAGDRRAPWSNYGPCVDLFAPGVDVVSAWASSDSATRTLSGTSMATPHVAGVAALYLQAHPSASPATVRGSLVRTASDHAVVDARSPSAALLFTGM